MDQDIRDRQRLYEIQLRGEGWVGDRVYIFITDAKKNESYDLYNVRCDINKQYITLQNQLMIENKCDINIK